MRLSELLPTLAFLVVFPLWLHLIARFIYRNSGWQKLAEYYGTGRVGGRFESIPRLVIGGTLVNFCKVRREDDFVILRLGLPFRLIAPHPPLKIPVSRIKMKGRNRGSISIRGIGIPFEGFDPRKLK
jgi:hypothetical protein